MRMVSLNYVKAGDQSLYQVGQGSQTEEPPGQQDRQRRAMEAAARAYFTAMKGG